MFFRWGRVWLGMCLIGMDTLSIGAMELQDQDKDCHCHFSKIPYELWQIVVSHTQNDDQDFSTLYSLRSTSKKWKEAAESVMVSSGQLVIPLSPTIYRDQNWIGRGVVSFATGIKLVGWNLSNAHLIADALTSLPFDSLRIKCIACPLLWSYTYNFIMKSYNDDSGGYTPSPKMIEKQRIYLLKSTVSYIPSPYYIGSGAPYLNWKGRLKPRYVYNLSQQQITSALEENNFILLNKHMSEDLGTTGVFSLTSALPRFPNLEELRLWSFKSIGASGGKVLGQVLQHLPKLRYVEVHGCMGPEGTQEFAKGLMYTPHLIALDLEQNGVGDLGCQAIVEQFPHLPELKHLTLAHVSHGTPGGNKAFITDVGVISLKKGLSQYSNIVSLNIDGHSISVKSIDDFVILLSQRKDATYSLFSSS